jgi:hypothetical protein
LSVVVNNFVFCNLIKPSAKGLSLNMEDTCPCFDEDFLGNIFRGFFVVYSKIYKL